jgi:hypothetical protein
MGGEHDGHRLGRPPGGVHLGRRGRKNDVDIQADQIRRELRQLLHRFRPPIFNGNVLAFDIAELTQAGPQRLDPIGVGGGGTKPQEPDPRALDRLLRAQRRRLPHHRDSQ